MYAHLYRGHLGQTNCDCIIEGGLLTQVQTLAIYGDFGAH